MANNPTGIGTPPAGGQGTTGGGSSQAPCGTGASPVLSDRNVILSIGLTTFVIVLFTIAGSMLFGNFLVKGWYWVALFSVLVILAVKVAKGEVDIEKVKGPAYKLAVLSVVLIVITTLWPDFKVGPIGSDNAPAVVKAANYPEAVSDDQLMSFTVTENLAAIGTVHQGFRVYYETEYGLWLYGEGGKKYFLNPSKPGRVSYFGVKEVPPNTVLYVQAGDGTKTINFKYRIF